eukprot:c16362_g1_i1.p1 GENE.c16362_g1_i1~~c16362_g1_i1.p1  ORF type:complete len:142 (+),score=22.00 c16362_g1_i1:34-459(+)
MNLAFGLLGLSVAKLAHRAPNDQIEQIRSVVRAVASSEHPPPVQTLIWRLCDILSRSQDAQVRDFVISVLTRNQRLLALLSSSDCIARRLTQLIRESIADPSLHQAGLRAVCALAPLVADNPERHKHPHSTNIRSISPPLP